jgi:nicotinic acid mononucleotide adenylyltransferase
MMLTTNEPNVDFTLALGADTFIDLASGKWRRTEDVFQLVGYRMIVFRRLLENDEHNEKDEILQGSIAKWQLINATKSSLRLVQIPSLTNASSSTVRGTTDEPILEELLTEEVLEYIKRRSMYSFAKSAT